MRIQKLLVFLVLSILIGCSPNQNQESDNNQNHTEPSNMSTSTPLDQTPSNQAKKTLQKYDETKKVFAVNSDKTLLIAVEVHHNDRLKLAGFRNKVSKKIKKQFPNLKTEVSTDKKLIIELNKLEKKISNNEISNKKLKKEMKILTKLMHEKT